MPTPATDLAVALERLADLVERIDPVGSCLRVADAVVDGSNPVAASLGGMVDLVTSLAALVDRFHRMLDEVEDPITTFAPHLARAAGSVGRFDDLIPLLGVVARYLGPLTAVLREGRPPMAGSGS